jgi:hypothetical protein
MKKMTLWVGCGMCAVLMAMAPGLAQHVGKASKTTAAAAPPPPATAMAAPAAASGSASVDEMAGLRNQLQTFAELGQKDAVTLQGLQRYHSVQFSVRADEIVTRLTLRLNFTLPPMNVPDAPPLEVLLNNEHVTTLKLPATARGSFSQEIQIDPRLVIDYNQLTLQLPGGPDCSDSGHASHWVQISPTSSLDLALAPLPMSNELAMLPAPFFDRHDSRPLEVALVMVARPGNQTLQAAGSVASWIGALASYRGTRLHQSEQLPTGHAIVLATADDRPAGISLPAMNGATVVLAPHPTDPRYKVLYLLGRDQAELRRAVDALVLGQLPPQGSSALITRDAQASPRQPHDAPNWLSTSRVVRLQELAAARPLEVAGAHPGAIHLDMRLPPDLFLWRSHGVPLDLRYHYGGQEPDTVSRLSVQFNGTHLREYSQTQSDGLGVVNWLEQRLWGQEGAQRASLRIPADRIGTQSHAQLSLAFSHSRSDGNGDCPRASDEQIRSKVLSDSTVDFSGAPHYLPMPDLAAFANAGFPFTRLADLSETAVLLPDSPSATELDTYLQVMARMGEATGYPAREVSVVRQRELARVADRELILIGTPASQPLLQQWAPQMRYAVSRTAQAAVTTEPHWMHWLTSIWRRDHYVPHGPLGFANTGASAALIGFESPLKAGRSVIALVGTSSEALADIGAALIDPKSIADIRGHVAVFKPSAPIVSYLAEPTYANGELPWITWIRWELSSRPVLLWAVLLGSIFVLSGLIYVLLRRLAERRHAGL